MGLHSSGAKLDSNSLKIMSSGLLARSGRSGNRDAASRWSALESDGRRSLDEPLPASESELQRLQSKSVSAILDVQKLLEFGSRRQQFAQDAHAILRREHRVIVVPLHLLLEPLALRAIRDVHVLDTSMPRCVSRSTLTSSRMVPLNSPRNGGSLAELIEI